MIQNNARLAEQARKRRMENKGHDQVFIKFRDSKKKVGDKVAKLRSNWVFNGEKIIRNKEGLGMDWGVFLGVGLLAALILSMGWVVYISLCNFVCDSPIGLVHGFFIVSGIATIFGVVAGSENYAIDWIRISRERDITSLLVKIYNSEGHRNIDEDELDRLYAEFGITPGVI